MIREYGVLIKEQLGISISVNQFTRTKQRSYQMGDAAAEVV